MIRLVLFTFLSFLISASAQAQSKDLHKKKRADRQSEVPTEVISTPQTDEFVEPLAIANVQITIERYYPYCGGAYPTDDQMNNYQPLTNTNFVLINLDTDEKTIVKTDSTGTLNLSLAPGKYGIKETYKDCTFEEFLKQHPIVIGGDTENQGEECYRNWWSSYLSVFTVTSPNLLFKEKCTLIDACFTGNNPCIHYFGPWPP